MKILYLLIKMIALIGLIVALAFGVYLTVETSMGGSAFFGGC